MNGQIGKTISKTFGKIWKFTKRHKTTIMTVAGLGCIGVAAVTAVKKTPEALMDVEDAKLEKQKMGENFTKMDAAKIYAKHYAVQIAEGVVGAGLIIASDVMDIKKIAELGATVKTARDTIQAIKEAETEVVGEKKALSIQEKADEKLVTPEDKYVLAQMPEGKNILCKDYISGITFISDFETLEKAEAAMKIEQAMYGSVDYGMFFEQIGIEAPPSVDGRFFNDVPTMVMRINRGELANEKTFVMVDWRDEPEYDPKGCH